MAALRYWIWLSLCCRARTANRLLVHFGDPEKIFFAEKEEIKAACKISERELSLLLRKNLTEAKKTAAECSEKGYRIIAFGDTGYPDRLKNIFDPPTVLYVKGNLPTIDEEVTIGIVGTRDCTGYGIGAADKLGGELAKSGCIVVSGLAKGIDASGAWGAVKNGGRVIGVLGCGLNTVYPPENADLYDWVTKNGAIVTEYPPETRPVASNFPERNRIMSGLSLGVTVVEAPERSGALITAELALEQGRDVFVIPGNVDNPHCAGSNRLMREGAIPILSGNDIATEYIERYPGKIRLIDSAPARQRVDIEPRKVTVHRKEPDPKPVKRQKTVDKKKTVEYSDVAKTENLSDDDRLIIASLGKETRHADEIVRITGLAPNRVLSLLTVLEINGFVKQHPGKYFSLK